MNEPLHKMAGLPRELRGLADSACNDTLTNAQRTRLEQILRDDQAAQLAYLAYLDIHAQLLWEGRSGTGSAGELPPDLAALLGGDREAQSAGSAEVNCCRRERGRHRRNRLVRWGLAAASAAALILLIVIGVRRIGRNEPVPAPTATWLVGQDAQWQHGRDGRGSITPSPGDPLSAGVYRLTAGYAAIRFSGGAEITLEAPAQLRVIDPHTGGLDSGRLTAVVPPGAAGFTIRTPRANIVDRGTQFGVAVDAGGETFVQVFEGRVEAELTSGVADAAADKRRIWPLTAMHLAADESVLPQTAPFEPLKFRRRCPAAESGDNEVATAPRISLDHNPDATAHVKALAAAIETAPATRMELGAVYQNCMELNDLTQSELSALVPALLEMLDDRRVLPRGEGQENTAVVQRVCDRAELVLEFVAGGRPAGEDGPGLWHDWWAVARGKSRAEWLAQRHDTLRRALARWRLGAPYPDNLYVCNAVEIAGRARDRAVLPVLLEFLRDELPRADATETCLTAVVDCVGRLGGPELVPDLVEQTRRLNDRQCSSLPVGFSEPHGRRGTVLKACALCLDRLAGTDLSGQSLQTVGPRQYEMWVIDEGAFAPWLAAARQRAARPEQGSPSDLPQSALPGPQP